MAITYNYSPDWIGRDTQPEGSDLRIIRASDYLTEWTAIQTAFASAVQAASPTITGTASFENVTISGTFSVPGYNNANWDTAFGWGDHAGLYPTYDGTGATGTWGISVSGNAATATDCSRSVIAGTNISGGGALSGDVTVNLDSTLTSLSDVQTANVSIGNWDITLDGSDLRFIHNGVDVLRLTTAGQLIAKDDVTAFGAP